MRTRRGLRPSEPADFALETADEAISFWDTISRILFTILPAFVSIALVVGGIVIMNIMLVSVMERTREIGVRKATGGTPPRHPHAGAHRVGDALDQSER